MDALEQARAPAPKREKLSKLLANGYTPACQEELVGILRHGLELKPWNGGEQLKLLQGICWWMVRLQCRTRYKTEWEAFLRHYDLCCAQAYTDFVEAGWDGADFIDTYESMLAEFVDVAEFRTLLAVKGSWEEHEDLLERVCVYEVGRRIFGFAGATVSNRRIQKCLRDLLGEVFTEMGINDKAIKTYRARAEERLAFVDASVRETPRLVTLEYLNTPWDRQVSDLEQEILEREYLFILNAAHSVRCDGGTRRVLPALFFASSTSP